MIVFMPRSCPTAATYRYQGLWVGLCAVCTACAVERIDEIIAEHGVTYWPSSSGEDSDVPEDTSTSTTTGTSSGAAGTDSSTSGGSVAASDGSSAETSESSSSSGGPEPVCGNGVVEDGETCDDGNDLPDDGCQACAKDSIIFVSSEVYQGFSVGGLLGADQRCRSLAAKANLPRFETFKAWLSTPATSAEKRLIHSPGRYILVNGIVVAADWAGLTTSPLLNPIMVDENSQTQDYVAWTGTLASGKATPGANFCGGWDDNSGKTLFGGTGLTSKVDSTWSFFEDTECGAELSLYCVEQ